MGRMPELPEVETVVRQLRPNLVGDVIVAARIHLPKIVRSGDRSFGANVRGRLIRRIDREGKRIVVRLEENFSLVIHLGMTGRLMIRPAKTPLDPHTQVCWRLAAGLRELRFIDPRQFGGVWLLPDDADWEHCDLRPLGPDALDLSLPVFRDLLSRPRQIKALLLDQQVIAGLGNIYCDEALHAAGIHPQWPANRLRAPQVARLLRALRRVLRASIAAGGTTISDYRDADGSEGAFQRRLRVYGREGELCRRCRGLIQRIQAAGRSSHLCPRCQPLGLTRWRR